MTKEKQKICRSFFKGWRMVPNGKVLEARTSIMNLWGVTSLTTFNSRKKGESAMSQADMNAVESVLMRYGIAKEEIWD